MGPTFITTFCLQIVTFFADTLSHCIVDGGQVSLQYMVGVAKPHPLDVIGGVSTEPAYTSHTDSATLVRVQSLEHLHTREMREQCKVV